MRAAGAVQTAGGRRKENTAAYTVVLKLGLMTKHCILKQVQKVNEKCFSFSLKLCDSNKHNTNNLHHLVDEI